MSDSVVDSSIPKRVALAVVGLVVFAVGVAGLAIPILPGWLLILTGLATTFEQFSWGRRLVARVRARIYEIGNRRRRG